MANSDTILGALDAEHLQKVGHLRLLPNGTMEMHRRRLVGRWSEIVNGDISLDITLDETTPTPAPSDVFATIPQRLDSRATLEYVGFSAEKATEIWNSWSKNGDGNTTSFVDFITSPFDTEDDEADYGDDEQWRRTMSGFGLSTDFQYKLIEPVFQDTRPTHPCSYWCKDAVEMRYQGLRYIQGASQDREKLLAEAQSQG
jgi:hypothetical protein